MKPPSEKPNTSTFSRFQRLDERDRVARHLLHRAWRLAVGRCDAGVVEGNHLALGGERVQKLGVPVVQAAAEVLHQDERHVVRIAEAAIRVTNSIAGFHELGRGVGGGDIGGEHDSFLQLVAYTTKWTEPP